MKRFVLINLLFLTFQSVEAQPISLPQMDTVVLKPKLQLYHHAGLEISGVAKSNTHDDVYWFHNDSGHEPRIFPITKKGEFFTSYRFKRQDGVKLLGAYNIDWEDMGLTNNGDIVIADFGNNGNARKDLLFYIIPEPAPDADFVYVRKKLFFNYPDQKVFNESVDNNYDAEAVFHAQGKIHVLTKNRSDTFTKLYRLDTETAYEVNPLTYIDKFDIRGRVTGADVSEDGNTLIVITYDAIWKFVKQPEDSSYFNGSIYWMPYKAIQIEAVCIDGQKLMLIEEATSFVFEVDMDQLVQVR